MNYSQPSRRSSLRAFARLPQARTAAPLGEDILLARHGANVRRIRQDRTLGVSVAELRSGGVDVAPNRLDGGAPVLAPAERAATLLGDYRAGRTGISRAEVRILGRVAAVWSVAAVAVGAGAAWVMSGMMDAETLRAMMAAGGVW